MAGAREWGEVKSFAFESSESFDSRGYTLVANQGGNGRVRKHSSSTASDYDGTNPFMGVNYVSTEDQSGTVQNLSQDDEHDVVTESAGQPVHAENEEYNLGEDVYLSQNNDGRVNKTDTSSARVGTVMEYVDHSSNNATDDNYVIVQFDLS